jgi:membrane associated rhomboid family serine protease
MTPWVRRLIVANVGVFILTTVSPVLRLRLGFIPEFAWLQPWTMITYMFVHGGIMHIAFNMIGLFFFGPRLEARLGARQFLSLYFVSGVMGAVLSIPFTAGAIIVGASGALFGVMLGYARYWPRDQIYIMGVLPIDARGLVVVVTVGSLVLGFTGGAGGIAHFAHLGGFLGAFLYLKIWDRLSPAARFRAKAAVAPKRKTSRDVSDLKRWSNINREELHPVNRDELDRIMSKIDAEGAGQLTSDELEFLERFSAR